MRRQYSYGYLSPLPGRAYPHPPGPAPQGPPSPSTAPCPPATASQPHPLTTPPTHSCSRLASEHPGTRVVRYCILYPARLAIRWSIAIFYKASERGSVSLLGGIGCGVTDSLSLGALHQVSRILTLLC